MARPIRVLLADDHQVVRRGLAALLLDFTDLQLVGEARTGREALDLCETTQPDVVLLDLLLPDMDCIQVTRAIREHYPNVRVIVMTSWDEHDLIQRALSAGAESYLLKDVGAGELAGAIRLARAATTQEQPPAPQLGAALTGAERQVLALIKRGFTEGDISRRLAISVETVGLRLSSIIGKLVPLEPALQAREMAASPGADLTDREREILALMARGLTNSQIGAQLSISRATVKFHVSHILSKLGATSRAEAAALAVQYHLISGAGETTTPSLATHPASDELPRSDEHLRAMWNSAPDAMALTDPAGIVFAANAAYYRLFGLTAQQVIGQSLDVVFPPEARSGAVERYRQLFEGPAQPSTFEAEVQHGDGTRRVVESRANLVIRDGRRVALLSVTRDVTERVHAQQALRESEERFRSYFELGLIGMAITSPAKGILEVNDQLCQILGYEREELLKMAWAEVTHPDDLAADVIQLNRVMAGEIDGYSLDKRWVRKDGQVIDATISVKCLRREDGSVDYFVALLQDITERKRAEAERVRLLTEVGESRRLFERIAETSPDSLYVYDFNTGQEVYVSARHEQVLGHTADEVRALGARFASTLWHPDDVPSLAEHRRRLRGLADGEIHESEYRLRQRDGAYRWLRSRSTVFARTASGQVQQIVGVTQNITEHKRLLEAQTAARQEVERANERIAHLQAATADLSARLTLDEVASVILRLATDALSASAGSVVVLSQDGATLELVKTVGYSEEVQRYWRSFPADLPTAPVAVVVRRKEPLWLGSLEERLAQVPLTPGAPQDNHNGAWAAIPLILDGHVVGSLGLSFSAPRTFDAEQRGFMLALAHQCAQALERAMLYEAESAARQAAERRAERIAHLQDLTAALSAAVRPSDVGGVLLRRISTMGATAGVLFLLSADGPWLELLASIGYAQNVIDGWHRFPVNHATAPLAVAVRENRPVWYGSLEEARSGAGPQPDHPVDATHQARAALPLVVHGHMIGGLGVSFPAPRSFDAEDRGFLQALADQCALALERARLYEAEAAARLEAVRANELRLRFLGMISHELRTPLTSIKGFASTLLAEDVSFAPAEQRDFLRIIDREADKLTDMIGQLLDLSRLEAGTLTIDPQVQTVSAILLAVQPQLDRLAAQHLLAIHLEDGLPAVRADGQRIAQVLTNLVGNAAKYAPPGTPIHLSAERAGEWVQVSIRDQGPGIAPEDWENVFEAFQRGRDEGTRHTQGAGLGLAICKGIIEAHGGRIWISDNTPHGTIISFTLPTPPQPP